MSGCSTTRSTLVAQCTALHGAITAPTLSQPCSLVCVNIIALLCTDVVQGNSTVRADVRAWCFQPC